LAFITHTVAHACYSTLLQKSLTAIVDTHKSQCWRLAIIFILINGKKLISLQHQQP